MDIAQVSMALANVNLQNSVGTAVLGNAMDMNEVQGANLVEMIDSAAMERTVVPHVGGNFDMSV